MPKITNNFPSADSHTSLLLNVSGLIRREKVIYKINLSYLLFCHLDLSRALDCCKIINCGIVKTLTGLDSNLISDYYNLCISGRSVMIVRWLKGCWGHAYQPEKN